jgi:hypothetical protein
MAETGGEDKERERKRAEVQKVIRVEVIDDTDLKAINILTPSERRDVLVEAGMQKAGGVAGRVVITVQRTSYAYGGRVPESAWHDVGTARTAKGLARIYHGVDRAIHPQSGSWSGHVRCVDASGEPVEFGVAMRMLGDDSERW